MANGKDTVVWEYPHGGNLLRFMVREYQGKTFAELRAWYRKDDEWRHGLKGCTMPLERIGELGTALTAYAAVNGLGGQSDAGSESAKT